MPARPNFLKQYRQWIFAAAGAGGVLILAVLIWRSLATDVPPASCEIFDLDCSVKQMRGGLVSVRETIAFWTWLNLAGQILTVVFGITATISIALLTDKNKGWTKPVGLLSSALAAGLTSAIITLQVPEKVDTLVDHAGKMLRAANDFELQYRVLSGERSKDDLQKELKSNAAFRNEFLKVVHEKTGVYNELKLELLKLGGTASKLRVPKKE